ncbi:MAG: AMP-binding protein, partial [Pleurocapsa sp.]
GAIIAIATGGTSGKIKFALHNLSTLTASVIGFCDYFQTETINFFCLLPLYHVSGLMQFFRSFLTGGKLEITDYKLLKKNIASLPIYRDFFISLVPTQLQFFLESNPQWLAEFSTVLIGGAPARRSLLARAREYRIPLALTYGMTETASQIATLKPDDFLQGNNSSGRVLPHAHIKILNDQNSTGDRVGLIQIEADSLCLGYYPQLFSTTKTLVTDDLGYLDEEGYLYVVGRNSHTIITGGEKVLPVEVEIAIMATKLVKEVCIIGIQDNKWGQIVTALYIPLKPDYNGDLIKQQLQAKIGKYKIPKYWIAVDRLPYSDRGKIDYQQVNLIAQDWLSKPL